MLNNFDNVPYDVLVKLAQAGNQEAFVALLLRHKAEIYTCIRNIVHNDEITNDLWQDTYVKSWRHIQKLKDPARFKPWLLKLAKNLAFDWLRKNSREKVFSLEEMGNALDPIDATTGPEVLAEDVIGADRVRAILARMEPLRRDVLLLYALGYTRAEIAQQLGYTEGTITTYLSEGRAQFQQLYRIMKRTDENKKEKEN